MKRLWGIASRQNPIMLEAQLHGPLATYLRHFFNKNSIMDKAQVRMQPLDLESEHQMHKREAQSNLEGGDSEEIESVIGVLVFYSR